MFSSQNIGIQKDQEQNITDEGHRLGLCQGSLSSPICLSKEVHQWIILLNKNPLDLYTMKYFQYLHYGKPTYNSNKTNDNGKL